MAPPQNQWPNYEDKPHIPTDSHSSIAIQVRNKGFLKFSSAPKGVRQTSLINKEMSGF
jgi:hypothetical protein